jgi:alkane 1-monooxygenase
MTQLHEQPVRGAITTSPMLVQPAKSPDPWSVLRFALVFTITGLPALCAWAAGLGYSWASAITLASVHLVIPLLDALGPADHSTAIDRAKVKGSWIVSKAFDWPVWCLPAWLVAVFSTLWFTQNSTGVTWLLCVAGLGATGGILAINPAHELIHRRSPWQRFAGGLLLASVNYGVFKIEHIRGHHRWVSTDRDTASAKRGWSVYYFAPRSILGTFMNGFKIEQQRINAKQLSWYQNEFWLWTGISSALAAALFFVAGWQAVGGFYLASLIAILELELINYIEHYGLRRKLNAQGEPEAVNEHHSWNCNTWVVNAFLFNLQRHADHHAHPGREYLALRDLPDAPRLPAGYGSMILLALVPPLWYKRIHPMLDAFEARQAITTSLPQTPD